MRKVRIQVITGPKSQTTTAPLPLNQATSIVKELYGVTMTGTGSATYRPAHGRTWEIHVLPA